MKTTITRILLIATILFGILFRFYNLNWDENHHLHPDERFLTMVMLDTQIPNSLKDYFNPETSTLNPRNVGHQFYVYGSFPLMMNKFLAIFLNNHDYNLITIQGRFLSALADVLVLFLIIKFARLLQEKYKLNRYFMYWAGAFYAMSVLMIQQSHFFTTDTFVNLFFFVSFFFSYKFGSNSLQKKGQKKINYLIMSAIFFGIGLGSKISIVYLLPIILIFLIDFSFKKKSLINNVFYLGIFVCVGYSTLRIADPYFFESKNFLNPSVSISFIENIKQLKSWEGSEVWFPPAIQWIPTQPVIFASKNIFFFGYGIVNSIFLIIGALQLIKKFLKINKTKFTTHHKLIFASLWIIVFFIYQSSQFAKAMRYFILIFPFMAITSAYGVEIILNRIKKYTLKNPINKLAIILLLMIGILIWPLMFMSIYVNRHPRIIASEWMYKNLPSSNKLINELWDDPLPLQVSNNHNKYLLGEMIPIFDPDTDEKWEKLNLILTKSDYYILSSNRGWGSITKAPNKYPITAKFYDDLLNNRTNYQKIAEFKSYPSLRYLGLPIDFPTDWADETFTVYDHPKVMIFRNNFEVK